jgi:dTDP-4-dehydrorhamnose reductase
MRRIVLTGADGQIGWELRRTLAPLGHVVACARHDLDFSELRGLRQQLRAMKPDVIVNAAAYTAVDAAETNEALALRVNAEAPRVLAEEAGRTGGWLVHYSTDYVFDGTKEGPYTEDDEPNPLSAYGRSKLAGERAIAATGARHLTFRTSWVYAARGRNFLLTMLKLVAERDSLRVVDDQHGAPTWARLVAEATALAVSHCVAEGRTDSRCGIYHLSCAGHATWREFAEAIIAGSSVARKPSVIPITTAEYPTPALRPRNSILANDRIGAAFGIRLPDWREALALCRADMEACLKWLPSASRR